MNSNRIEKLLKIVPPPEKVINGGSPSIWSSIKRIAGLPDWLYPYYSLYGSGFFTVFDSRDGFVDNIQTLNVFEDPLLERHKLLGGAFEDSNMHSKLPYQFFP